MPRTSRSRRILSMLPVALAVTVAMTGTPTPAQAQSIGELALAHRAGELTWLRETAEVWRGVLKAQSAAYSNSATADAATRERLMSAWNGAVTTAFNGEKMTADVETVLSLAFKPEELTAVMAFYDTDLGRRIHLAEQPHPGARTADLNKEKAELMAAFRRLQVDRKRRDFLAGLATAMGGAEGEVDALSVVSAGTTNGMLEALPAGKPRPDSTQLEILTSAQRTKLRATLEPLLLPTLERRYARFTLAELKAYLAELSTPLAQRFLIVFRAASNEALRRQAVAIGRAFAQRLNAQSL